MMKHAIQTVIALALVLPAAAFAEPALFEYKTENKVQTDQGVPMLILRAREFIEGGEVTFERSDGKKWSVALGKMEPTDQKRIPIKQPKNTTFEYDITLEGKSQFDQTMKTSFETTITYVEPIDLDVDRQTVKVGEGKLTLQSNVPLAKVDIEVYDNDGKKFVAKTQKTGGEKGDVEINWPAKTSEVGAIRLKATDEAGFWASIVLEPFWVEIPHEEVNFHFGKATWDDSQTPRLKATLESIREAMKKHAKKGLTMQLYIAGYTDTVGSHADNYELSSARAKAIASWFRKNGLKIPIYYQGFGESVLAVQTPDDTKNEKNRRALYILGNSPPPRSGQIPKDAWKEL